MALGLGEQLDREFAQMHQELLAMRRRIDELEKCRGGQLAYSVKECAEVMGVGEHNIRELIRGGQLPAFKLEDGKQRYMIYRSDLEEFIRVRKLRS